MDKKSLFVMAVLFELHVMQDGVRLVNGLFLNLNFGAAADRAATHAAAGTYELSDAKAFAGVLLKERIAEVAAARAAPAK